MRIERIELRHIKMILVSPFVTSMGTEYDEEHIIVKVDAEGVTGWGESVAEGTPYYSYETVPTAWHILNDFLIPSVLGKDLQSIDEAIAAYAKVRGHMMAKAGLEAALWDAFAKSKGISLSEMLGGTRKKIDVGVSIGIQDSVPGLIKKVEGYLAEGYKRIKIKIAPGFDMQFVEALRKQFDHSKLQRELKTPICLDESIHSLDDTRAAIELDSCRVINIKPGRVGGYTESKLIHDYCAGMNIPVWHGGMLESGIGRAGNVALASLPNFTLPGDLSASKRYYKEDIVDPEFVVNPDGTMDVPTKPGIGVEVNMRKLDDVTLRSVAQKA